MARDLLTIRCPEDIKQAIEEKIFTTGKAKTDVVLDLLRTALGMPSTATNEVSTTSLDERITVLLDNRTTSLYDQVNARVEEAIAQVRDALSAMATQLGERQETYKQWLNEAREIGRELERSKWQSPSSAESAIGGGARLGQLSGGIAETTTPTSEPIEIKDKVSAIPNIPVSQEAGSSSSEKGETASFLAKRFGKEVSTITRAADRLSEEKFKEWSRKLDPDKIAWEQVPGTGTSKKDPKRYRKVSAVSS